MKKGQREKNTWLFCGLLLAGGILIFQGGWFQRATLNESFIIHYFVFFLSIIIFLLFKRKEVREVVKSNEKLFIKALLIFGLFFKYTISFFIMIISISLLIFGSLNNNYSKNNPIECFSEKIVHASSGTSRGFASIQFYFKDKINSLSDTKEVYKLLNQNKNQDWQVSFCCRKGLLGTYILESWSVKQLKKN